MVYDLGGEERIGGLTGLYYFASSASAAAITWPILAGTLIDLTGKNYALLWIFSAAFRASGRADAAACDPINPQLQRGT